MDSGSCNGFPVGHLTKVSATIECLSCLLAKSVSSTALFQLFAKTGDKCLPFWFVGNFSWETPNLLFFFMHISRGGVSVVTWMSNSAFWKVHHHQKLSFWKFWNYKNFYNQGTAKKGCIWAYNNKTLKNVLVYLLGWFLKTLSHSHIFLSIVASAIQKQSFNMFRLTLMFFPERNLFT